MTGQYKATMIQEDNMTIWWQQYKQYKATTYKATTLWWFNDDNL